MKMTEKLIEESSDSVNRWKGHYESELGDHQRRLAFLNKYKDALDSLPDEFPIPNLAWRIQWSGLTHPQILELIKAIGGKWDKQIDDTGATPQITYKQLIDDIYVSASSEPPPCCEIIEVEEEVPACVRTVRKIKCPEGFVNKSQPVL